MSYKKMRLLLVVIYTVIGFILYSAVVLNGIFLFDDFEYVVDNPIIQNFSYFMDLNEPRFFGYLSFALNYYIGGEVPAEFHLVNVMIHIINAILIFFVVELILNILGNFRNEFEKNYTTTAFLTGFIFLIHPVQTQAVSYVTQRFTSLCALFYLLSVLLYLMSRTRLEKTSHGFSAYMLYGLSILSALLAMKTKEIAFSIPFIIAIFEVLLFKNSIYLKRRFIYAIPFMALLIIVPLSIIGPEWGLINPGKGVAEIVRKDKIYDLTERSGYEYLLNQFRVIVIYIRLLILPMNQLVVYDLQAAHSFFELRVMLSLFFLLSLAGCALYLWLRAGKVEPQNAADYRFAALGIIWFFITLSIESSVIPIKDIIFEHRVYLPSAGFISAASLVIVRLSRRVFADKSLHLKVGIISLFIGIIFSITTYSRNDIWTDEVKFWDDVVRKTGKAIGYNNRGNAYAKTGQYELALHDLDKTITFFPKSYEDRLVWERADFTPTNMAKTYMNRGNIYYILGFIEQARADFDMAKKVMMTPPHLDKNLKRADQYYNQGAYIQAIKEYSRVLEWDPENVDVLNNRGNAFSRSGLYNDAIQDFNKIISLRPDFAPAYYNRGIALLWSGNKTRTLEDFKKACEIGLKPACESLNGMMRGIVE